MMYRALFRKLMFVQALSILSTTVAVIIDSSITSLFLGQTALSAAGIVMPLVQFFATIGGSVAVGFQTVVARKLGQGDSDGASALFNFILIFTLFLSAFSAICVIFLSGPLAELLGTTRGTYEYTQAAGYLKGYAIGIPAYSLILLLTPVMFIDSDKNRVAAATLLMVVVDILLDLLNVLVIKQEMFGMAAASSVSYMVSAGVLLLHFTKKGTAVSLNLRSAKPNALGAIAKNSTSYTIYHICKSALTFCVNRLLIAFGKPEEVAVYAALSSLALLLTSVGSALGSVTLSFSSLFHGESDISRERQLRRTFTRYSLTVSGTIAVIVFIFAPFIARLFIRVASPQFNSCVVGLRLLGLSLTLNSVNNCYRNYFQGVAELGRSLAVCILQYLAAPVCALFVILQTGGRIWIWLFYIVAELMTFLVVMRLKGNRKEPVQLDEEILIGNTDRIPASIDMLRQILSDNGITAARMQCVNTVLNAAAALCAEENQRKSELNLRAYELGSELKCSIETNLADQDGRLKQLALADHAMTTYSEVFGLKRVIIGGLRND